MTRREFFAARSFQNFPDRRRRAFFIRHITVCAEPMMPEKITATQPRPDTVEPGTPDREEFYRAQDVMR